MSSRTRGEIAADAIVAEMNDPARSWTQAFVAARQYIVSQDKQDTKAMQALVQANGSVETQITRRHRQATHAITVTFKKNVDPTRKAAVDALNAFVEEVGDYFRTPRSRHQITGTNAYVVDVRLIPPNPDSLETDLIFFAGLGLVVSEVFVP